MDWEPLFPENDQCQNKIGEFEFFGSPMSEHEDKSVVTLYDKNGVIAGIQAYVRTIKVLPNFTQ